MMDVIRNSSKLEWFLNQEITINGRYSPVFAEIPTERGIGFTFNLLDAEELLNFKR